MSLGGSSEESIALGAWNADRILRPVSPPDTHKESPPAEFDDMGEVLPGVESAIPAGTLALDRDPDPPDEFASLLSYRAVDLSPDSPFITWSQRSRGLLHVLGFFGDSGPTDLLRFLLAEFRKSPLEGRGTLELKFDVQP